MIIIHDSSTIQESQQNETMDSTYQSYMYINNKHVPYLSTLGLCPKFGTQRATEGVSKSDSPFFPTQSERLYHPKKGHKENFERKKLFKHLIQI